MDTSPSGSARSRMPIVATVGAIGAVFVTAVLGLFFDHTAADEALLRETIADADTLRIAELTLGDFEDGYVPCGSPEEARVRLDRRSPDWPKDGCWAKIGFVPNGPGGYWVEVNGQEFTVHGIISPRNDGELVEVVATKGLTARRP